MCQISQILLAGAGRDRVSGSTSGSDRAFGPLQITGTWPGLLSCIEEWRGSSARIFGATLAITVLFFSEALVRTRRVAAYNLRASRALNAWRRHDKHVSE
jgi:hypothetical protein